VANPVAPPTWTVAAAEGSQAVANLPGDGQAGSGSGAGGSGGGGGANLAVLAIGAVVLTVMALWLRRRM